MRSLLALGCTAAVALSAGCSAGSHRYASAVELRSAAVNAGLHCTGYAPTALPDGAQSAGACMGGTKATFVVYGDEAAATKGAHAAQAAAGSGMSVLHGPNWYMVAATPDIDGVHDAVGGDVAAGE